MSVLLVDLRDSNVIDECDTKLEALEFVRKMLDELIRQAMLAAA